VDFDPGENVAALRQRLRHLIREETPAGYRGPFADGAAVEFTRRFCRILAEERLLTIDWPEEFGGAGADVWEQIALREEMWAHDEPRGAQYMGVSWVGPTIMRFGTAEQRAEHLPRIASGEVTWCQGFSEPDAGSDLGALKLSARPEGDGGWRLNGQKTWTSYADLAQWCFLAARTSADGTGRENITIFLVPLDRPGIAVRPIPSILGDHHLNEVFFDEVPVTAGDVLGEVGRGWDVISAVLSFERVGIPRYARSDRLLARVAEALPLLQDDPDGRRSAHARLLVRCRVARLLAYRALADHQRGEVPLSRPALARIASTTLDQEVAELILDVLGPDAVTSIADQPLGGAAEDVWRYARASTVAAGTTEIQRHIVARDLTSVS
jgi:alkylation response protein AidB-like acyl-CoA dehydrogenase